MTNRKDAEKTADVLASAGLEALACDDARHLCRELDAGAGALLLTEEAIFGDREGCLLAALAAQPAWSSVPLVTVVREGAAVDRRDSLLSDFAANVTLIERPVRMRTLVSVVRGAVRARRHQYVARDAAAELERHAAALRESEARYRALIGQVRDYAIFRLDLAGRATSWNEGVGRVLGFDEQEFLGIDTRQAIFDPEDVERGVPDAELAEAASTGRAGNDRWMKKKDGTRFFATGSTTALRDDAGNLVGFTKVMRDQTEWKRAEEALKEADRRKDEFLATLAHELRNPLAPISNILQVWPLVANDPAKSEEMREMMGRQVRQMVRLIDDLLDVSRISRGKIELRKERLDLATVVEGALEGVRPFVESRRHALTVSMPSEPVALDGDLGRLMQVFGNLVHNAAKYTGRDGHIRVAARRDGGEAVVSVRDDGPGIPREMLSGIFGMFTQVDRTLDRAHGGLGIGLTLVKTLVEMHGGSVEAFSEGRGSEFVVRLPAVAEGAEPAAARPATAESHGTTSSLLRRRVLVVDDVRPSARTLAMMLTGLGQETRTEHDGPSALAAAPVFRPDVVLLDIAMPGMDGYEVARRMRRDTNGRTAVLVALTGFGQEEDRRRAFEAGFDHHLVKPTSVDALRELLSGLPVPEIETPGAGRGAATTGESS
jgi:two-component system CheB/CheR fusion protein